MAISLMDFITGMGIYLCALFFFFLVTAASFQYYVAITKASTETIKIFIESLNFPFTIYKYYPYQNLDDYQRVSKFTAMWNRLVGLFFTSIALVILIYQLNDAVKNQNISLFVLYIFWIILYFVTLFYSLRFGQKLKGLIKLDSTSI